MALRGALTACALAFAIAAGGVPATAVSVVPTLAGSAALTVPMSTAAPAVGATQTATALLQVGSRGPAVVALQQRLSVLGYWLGANDGVFGNLTQQAVYAVQKAAGLARDGIVGPMTLAALRAGTRPSARSRAGRVVEIDLSRNLLLLVTDGHVDTTLNTSTGGGYTYLDRGVRLLAITPRGHFTVTRQVNGLVVSRLGRLWRPKYFYAGYAIHGYPIVPPVPASHGCVRLSNAAIDWIWSTNRVPLRTPVWVY